MTSQERVITACNHRDPDRIPIDLSGHRSSGIAAIAYAKLRDYLRLPKKAIRVYDPIQQLAIIDDDVLDRFGVDVIDLGRGFALDEASWSDWTLPDGTPCKMPAWALPERENGKWVFHSKSGRVIAHMPAGALYFEQTYFPLVDPDGPKTIPEAMQESMWHSVAAPPGPWVNAAQLKEGAAQLRKKSSRAIVGAFGGNLLEAGQFLFRNDNFFMLLGAEPERAHKFLDDLVAVHMVNLESFLGAVGDSIDIIGFGDDLGMQSGPQISPRMYREFFKPRHQAMWRRAKQLADVKVMLHCCGGVRELLPDLIDAGLEIINPVQVSCAGMNAGELKTEFGKDIVFWGGGCDTQTILPDATPDEVRRHVRKQIAALSPHGGFVFQQVHNTLANVPPANIVAMYEAVQDWALAA
ncbi:MAG: uroporphyrinogen decarboxylase family protein [Terriglobia bacterium]|jgi:uroporphyrinogen decarboxylase